MKINTLFISILTAFLLISCSEDKSKSVLSKPKVEEKSIIKPATKPKIQQKKPNVPAFSALKKKTLSTRYVIDAVNGVKIAKAKQPISIKGNRLNIAGWAVDIPNKTVAGGVYVLVDGKPYAANYGNKRLGVSKLMKNNKMLNSGFSISIPINKIGKGIHNIAIHVINADKKAVYAPVPKRNIKINIQ